MQSIHVGGGKSRHIMMMGQHALEAAQYLLEDGGTFRSPSEVPPRMTILAGTDVVGLRPLLVFGFVTNAVGSAPPAYHNSVSSYNCWGCYTIATSKSKLLHAVQAFTA